VLKYIITTLALTDIKNEKELQMLIQTKLENVKKKKMLFKTMIKFLFYFKK